MIGILDFPENAPFRWPRSSQRCHAGGVPAAEPTRSEAFELLVLADDRTGAIETAGICADVGWGPVPVSVLRQSGDAAGVGGPAPSAGSQVAVIDAGTRHLDRDSAARRVAAIDHRCARVLALKIDSTLRGNWATEIVAIHSVTGTRVVVVPAFPGVGRICRGGEVLEHGRPVGEGTGRTDARGAVVSSRPAEHLRRAGATAVAELADAGELTAWLASLSTGVAVCDAETDADLDALAAAWVDVEGVVFAGTARSIGAAAAALHAKGAGREFGEQVALRPPLPLPAIVVCGSLHDVARRQIEQLRDLPLADSIRVLSTPVPDVFPVTHDAADRAARQLLREFKELAAARPAATLFIIGGDTAAVLLGDDVVEVGGTVSPGVPWMRRGEQLVVTRAGGFGDDLSLVRLFSTKMEP